MRSAIIATMFLATWALGLFGFYCLMLRLDPPQVLPLVQADYPLCMTVNPKGDLEKPKGRRSNGRAPVTDLS